jgi:hypothetical protein
MPEENGLWYPVLGEKQRLLYDCPSRYILVSGPRRATKTIAVAKKIIRHAWETKAARVGIVCKNLKSGKDGPWPLLCDLQRGLVNEWIDAGVCSEFGTFDYEPMQRGRPKGPRLDGTTRQPMFNIVNRHGGLSEFRLISLDHEPDVERVFLGTTWSAIWVSELQNFRTPGVFTVAKEQLRMAHLQSDEHFWIADTNPPDEGDLHWAYKYWFEQRVAEEAPDIFKTEQAIADFRGFQKRLALFQFEISDNIFEDPMILADLRASYAGDPEGYDRFILGKWTRGTGLAEKWFARVFRRGGADPHVLGECLGTDESKWTRLLPVEGCRTLYLGFDIGEVNHGFAILQKRNGANGAEWDILDEVVCIGEEVVLEEVGYECVAKVEKIEEEFSKPFELVAWGDCSMEKFRPGTPQGNDAAVIEAAFEGRLEIQFATGEDGSQKPRTLRRRLMLIKTLLEQGRIRVSANCTKTIEMFENLRRGNTAGRAIRKEDPNKHIFDAISYVIYAETIQDGEAVEQRPSVRTPVAVSAPY